MTNFLDRMTMQEMIQFLIEHGLGFTRNSRSCPELTDAHFIELCLTRVFETCQSGREFLQVQQDLHGDEQGVRSTFFHSLNSTRRSMMTEEVVVAINKLINKVLSEDLKVDYLNHFSDLNDYEVYACDGHYIENASNLKGLVKALSVATKRKSKYEKKTFAAGNLYLQNLRTGLLHFGALVTDGSRKNHEMPVLRSNFEHFRKSNKLNSKLVLVIDRGILDKLWFAQISAQNCYVISRIKRSI